MRHVTLEGELERMNLAEIETLRTENSKLREALRKLEWNEIDYYIPYKGRNKCVVCWCSPIEQGGDGHSFDCWLAEILK